MRPGFSVTSRSPVGSGSTDHGFSSPRATTVTSNATLDFTPHVRVCPAKAGCWSGALAARVSMGTHGSPTVPALCSIWFAAELHAVAKQAIATAEIRGLNILTLLSFRARQLDSVAEEEWQGRFHHVQPNGHIRNDLVT